MEEPPHLDDCVARWITRQETGLLGGLAADYFLVPVLQGAVPEGVLHLHCYAIGRIWSPANGSLSQGKLD